MAATNLGRFLVSAMGFFVVGGALNVWTEPLGFISATYLDLSDRSEENLQASLTAGFFIVAVSVACRIYKMMSARPPQLPTEQRWLSTRGVILGTVFFIFVAAGGQALKSSLSAPTTAIADYSNYTDSQYFPYESLLEHSLDTIDADQVPEKQVMLTKANVTSRCSAFLYLLDENAKGANEERIGNVNIQIDNLFAL